MNAYAPPSLGDVIPLRNQIVLEIGCGTITQAPEVIWNGSEYVGLDISPSIVRANEQSLPSAEFICGPAESLSSLVRGKQFSLILSIFGALQFGAVTPIMDGIRAICEENARLVMAARHPSLHKDGSLPDLGRAPQLRTYAVGPKGGDQKHLLMNITDKIGWQSVFTDHGWELVNHFELDTSNRVDTSVYVAHLR